METNEIKKKLQFLYIFLQDPFYIICIEQHEMGGNVLQENKRNLAFFPMKLGKQVIDENAG